MPFPNVNTRKDKSTAVRSLDVTGMSDHEIEAKLARHITNVRCEGWHFSSAFPMDWKVRDGKTYQLIYCVFCK